VAPPGAGAQLVEITHAAETADGADREAHAPSNAACLPMVTSAQRTVTGHMRGSPSEPDESWCQVKRVHGHKGSFEGVANGGDSANALASPVIARLLSVHTDGRFVPWVCRRHGVWGR
jgi:hypothetical protein